MNRYNLFLFEIALILLFSFFQLYGQLMEENLQRMTKNPMEISFILNDQDIEIPTVIDVDDEENEVFIDTDEYIQIQEFTCICNDQLMKSIGELKRHIKTYHRLKDYYTCPICIYKTINFSPFLLHVFDHTKQILFECKLCDYGTFYKSNMKRHVLSHEKKYFKCDFLRCNYKSTTLSPIINHKLNAHYEESVLICDYPECTYSCKNSYDLQVHKGKHSDEKPFKCNQPGCISSFKFKGNLKRHLRKIHFYCENCDLYLENREEAQKHNKTLHTRNKNKKIHKKSKIFK